MERCYQNVPNDWSKCEENYVMVGNEAIKNMSSFFCFTFVLFFALRRSRGAVQTTATLPFIFFSPSTVQCPQVKVITLMCVFWYCCVFCTHLCTSPNFPPSKLSRSRQDGQLYCFRSVFVIFDKWFCGIAEGYFYEDEPYETSHVPKYSRKKKCTRTLGS